MALEFVLAVMRVYDITTTDLKKKVIYDEVMAQDPDEKAWLETQQLGKEGRREKVN